MKSIKVTLAVVASLSAGIALAHSGATGVVKQRMDGMAAMQKAVKAITPIMRGQVDYDPEAVRAFAASVEMHSGEAMTKLFPEGTGGKPSEAKDSVWSDWEGFEKLAVELEVLGRALGEASENGMASAEASTSGSSMMGTTSGSSMMGTTTMMGGQATMGGMMGQADDGMMDADMLAAMPADALFTRISQTCSACHTKYRAESN
ncbi:c-type cytochrome [Pseudaestuariivita atlantica]|uniref:Cytochrome C n=1 Tax=Pseudaestuariivita atlantica TaxID=1317121 RepID=A0A0L1JW94_9RHOB|nr:cytochrome c [Pseudaestuariivita atlantica]KNG95678.1 hypothetical protein ATO11_01980 [Pseudaestuariivita atlantica]